MGEGANASANQLADLDSSETLSEFARLRELEDALLTVYGNKLRVARTVRFPSDLVEASNRGPVLDRLANAGSRHHVRAILSVSRSQLAGGLAPQLL